MMRVLLVCALVFVSSVASAQQAAPTRWVDEGFTFYSVDHASVSGSEPPASEWWLKASLRLVGQVPERSVLYYVLKRGRTRLGEVRCDTRTTFSTNARASGTTFPHVFVTDCQDRALRVREVGEHQVEWHLQDGSTDADTVLVTHTITVRAAPRFDVGSQRPWYPALYVDRNAELLSTVLHHHPNGAHRYVTANIQVEAGATLDLVVNAAPTWGTSAISLSDSHIRCRANGEPVDLRTPYVRGPTRGTRTDRVSMTESGASLGEEMVPNPTGNPRYDAVQYLFRRYVLVLPLTFGPANDPAQRPDATTVSDRPGTWECDWRSSDGRTLRTFRFVVGADGRVVDHAEQDEGLTLAPDAVLIETVVPEGNPLDARTDPAAPARAAFSGRGFRTEQGRAMRAPAIGQPFPRSASPSPTGRTNRRR